MNEISQGSIQFFYVVHGLIAELDTLPGSAYRRAGRELQCDRKALKCPFCTHRLTDTGSTTIIELYKHPARISVACDLYLKCEHCRNEVGIKIA